jgi:hypothetical protein
MSGNPGDIIFNSFINYPLEFDFPLPYLNELDIYFTYPDGTLVDFRNIDHSFTLRIVEKIIIKVGKVIPIDEKTLDQLNLNEIIEKGEEIYKGIRSESTVFIEKIQEGLLIRPVDEYYINKDQFKIETEHSINDKQFISIHLIQHLLFKEGEKIESIKGIDLVKTYLTVDILSDGVHGSADIEFLETKETNKYKLQIAILENLQILEKIYQFTVKRIPYNCILNSKDVHYYGEILNVLILMYKFYYPFQIFWYIDYMVHN